MPNSDEIVQNEATPPQPVLINPAVEESSISRQDHTEEIEPSIVFIRAPKFKHPSRTVSSFALIIALITFLVLFVSAFANYDIFLLDAAVKSCCMMLNVAFVSEIVFYSHLLQHNKENSISNVSTVFSIVLFTALSIAGIMIFVTSWSY